MALSTEITFTDLLSTRFAPIQDALMALLDPLDNVALMLTSKKINENVNQKLKAGQYNINARLQPFFRDPRAFRSMQAHCSAFISSVFAHCFFIESIRCPGLLLYVGQDVDAMLRYLEAEGYVEATSKTSGNGEDAPSYKRYEKCGPEGSKFIIGVLSSHRQSAVQMALHMEHYELDVTTKFRHPVLEHLYSTPRFGVDDLDPYYRKIVRVFNRLCDTTVIEMTKMDEEKRPAEYATVKGDISKACELRGKFVTPKSWCFFDDEVRAYLMVAWEEQVKLEEEEEEKKRRSD